MTNELVRVGATSLLLFDPNVVAGDRPDWSGDTFTWLRVADQTHAARQESLRKAIALAGAVIGCGDAPGPLPRIVSRMCDGHVPLVWCELTESGAQLQTRSPHASDTGCVSCVSEFRARRDVIAAAVTESLEQSLLIEPPWRFHHRAEDVATAATFVGLAVREALRAAEAGVAGDARLHVLDFEERTARAHAVPRHYACRRCRPPRSRPATVIRDETQRRWATDWETIRPPRELLEIGAALRSLVDSDLGVFERLWTSGAAERRAVGSFIRSRDVRPGDTPFIDATRAVVTRPHVNGRERESVATEGFDFTDPDVAVAIALAEGAERAFALDHVDPSRLCRARYADLGDTALDPRELPLFSEEQYGSPEFPFRRFDPTVEMNWLWGVRISNQTPVLVPAALVGRQPEQLLRATSNGAACHSSLHHAVLNGLYEVIERDALMMTWLNRWSCPRLQLAEGDPDPHGIRAALERLSFRLTHVDLTTELGVPVVLAVLEDEHDPALFVLNMVAGLAGPRVLAKLYRELAQFLYPHLVDQSAYRTPTSRSQSPSDVRTLQDHLAFYQNGARRPLTAFLASSIEEAPFAGMTEQQDRSIGEELREVLARVTAAGYSPIAVDCTPELLRELGLWVVKVVVPGTQPLQVGHDHAALGDKRLAGAARTSGRARAGTSARPLNPWPHPFW